VFGLVFVGMLDMVFVEVVVDTVAAEAEVGMVARDVLGSVVKE